MELSEAILAVAIKSLKAVSLHFKSESPWIFVRIHSSLWRSKWTKSLRTPI